MKQIMLHGANDWRLDDLAVPEHTLMADAHRYLLDHGGDVSFWENGWLRSGIARWEADAHA